MVIQPQAQPCDRSVAGTCQDSAPLFDMTVEKTALFRPIAPLLSLLFRAVIPLFRNNR